jgi:hypothetical protein
MADDKKLVPSFFESEQKADEAVEFLKQSQIARDDAIGILVLDESGQVKTKYGRVAQLLQGRRHRRGAGPTRPDRDQARRDRRGRGRPAAPRNHAAHRACPAITGNYRCFSPARPISGDPRPRSRIASSTPESPKSSSHRALRAMARPGLEPGTPRFSVVRVGAA